MCRVIWNPAYTTNGKIDWGKVFPDSNDSEAISYALKADKDTVKVIVEAIRCVTVRRYRNEILALIEREANRASSDTGYGKSQRRICERLYGLIACDDADDRFTR